VAYLVDYSVASSGVQGTNCKGSIYIRGIKGDEGIDSFKFTLEKSNDFSDLDSEIMVSAYEEALVAM